MKPMTDKETLKRIKKDAHDFTEGWGENCDIRSFIAGAKSERNQVLDEAIDRIPKEWNNYATLNDIIRTLESLKL